MLEAQWLELETMFRNETALARLQGHHVLVICYNGDTARVATSVLRAKGIEADSLRGGYQALRDHGLWGENGADATAATTVEKPAQDVAVPMSPISVDQSAH